MSQQGPWPGQGPYDQGPNQGGQDGGYYGQQGGYPQQGGYYQQDQGYYQQPDPSGYYGYGAPPPPKKSKTPVIIAAGLVVVIVAVAVVLVFVLKGNNNNSNNAIGHNTKSPSTSQSASNGDNSDDNGDNGNNGDDQSSPTDDNGNGDLQPGWTPAMREAFVSSCGEDEDETVCGCIFDKLETQFTLNQFLQADQQYEETGSFPVDFESKVVADAASCEE